ncbi:cytochrome P450 [Argonema antarcticum]|uniref:cytochrome P450 n=1 Tax=Argonema antarcticum TaxID=2942763 RepID=UPI002010EF36|nr:cytochrome P450 [Argonema antarcticum]MCL1472572.1 cytochrome P450 [Argonema antarcticum A004/B2]
MKLPDGPQSPLWLETLQFVFRPVEFLEARALRYGDAFTIGSQSNSPVVYLSHPQALKEIFTADPNLFDSGCGNKLLLEPLFGEHSLLMLDGERHQRHRRLLMPPFHGQRMRTYGQLIHDITTQAIDQWPIGQPFPIRLFIQEIALRSILQAVFGLHQGNRYALLRQLLSSYLDSIASPITAAQLYFPDLQRDLGSWSPWGQFVRLRKQIDELLYSEIEERRQSIGEERADILSLLLITRDEASQPLTNAELRDQLLTLLIAGYETSASALTWALYGIHYLPEVKSKLLDEIDANSLDTDPSAIAKLPYLTAVCSETLRLYPVVVATSNRILKAPLQIMGYQFEPDTVLMPCIYLTHQREDLYPDPKSFNPERFLDRQFSPYEYLPFGGGSRACIGMAFAQFEMKLVLATILSRLELALPVRRAVKPIRRGPTVAPPADLQLVVTGQRQRQKVLTFV